MEKRDTQIRSHMDRLPPELQRRIQAYALLILLNENFFYRSVSALGFVHTMRAVRRLAEVLGYPCAIDEMLPTPRLRPFDRCVLVTLPIHGVQCHVPQRRAPGAVGWQNQHTSQECCIVSPLTYYDLAAPIDQILRVQCTYKFYDSSKATSDSERRALDFLYDYVMDRAVDAPDLDLKKEVELHYALTGYWQEGCWWGW